VKLSVDGFALFVFPLIRFPKLQNSCSAFSFPGVRGGGSKLGHSYVPWQAKKMLG